MALWALGISLYTTASFQNINLQQAQGATKQARLSESLHSLLISRTEVNNTHHSAAQFSIFFFFPGGGRGEGCGLESYFISFRFSIVFFSTIGELHVDNRCQIGQPQKLIPCVHAENITYSVQAVAELAPPQCHSCIFPS